MERVSVIGNSGTGKTTVAQAIGEALAAPVLELDSIYHLAGWTPGPDREVRADTKAFIDQGRWVVDGNYTSLGVLDVVWAQADTVVWLDLSRSVTMRRVVARTLRRVLTREELWNGNREPWNNLFDPRPEQNIIVWSWTRHRSTRRKYEARSQQQEWGHLDFIRLQTPAAIDQLLASLTAR